MIKVRGEFQKPRLMEGFGQLRLRKRDLSCAMGLYESQIADFQSQINQESFNFNSLVNSNVKNISDFNYNLNYWMNSTSDPSYWMSQFLRDSSNSYFPSNASSVSQSLILSYRKIATLRSQLTSYQQKETAWQEQERLLLQEQTKAAQEEATHVEELQTTIENLNMQLRANKNMNITLNEQVTALQDQVSIFRDKISLQEGLINEQKAQINSVLNEKEILNNQLAAVTNENAELKSNIQSMISTGEAKPSTKSALLTSVLAAGAGYVAAKSL